MPDRRPERLAALVEELARLHLDGILLTSLSNIRYLTGFVGTSALVFVTGRGDVLFVSDFRYQTQAAEQVGDFARVVIEPSSLWAGLWRELAQLSGVQVAGFESGHLLHRDFQRLLEGGGGGRWTWRPTLDVVERLRERKVPEEVALIRDAAGVAERALRTTLDAVRPGRTEIAIAGMLERALREEGSEGFPFETIVASGPRSALPHARAADRMVEPGDFLLIDFGAIVGGYCSDITRTAVVGRSDERQRELYEVVRTANQLASSGVRAGMRGRDADALARDYIDGRGLSEAFGHSLGHGLGLDVHEAPRLARGADAILPVGAVVTIEPGAYLPGWGGVRIEDDVHLTVDGVELLTHFPRDLIEL